MPSVVVDGDGGSGQGGASLILDGSNNGLGIELNGGTVNLQSDNNQSVTLSGQQYFGPGNLMFGSSNNQIIDRTIFPSGDGGTMIVTVNANATTAQISSVGGNAFSGLVLLDGNNVTFNTVGGTALSRPFREALT